MQLTAETMEGLGVLMANGDQLCFRQFRFLQFEQRGFKVEERRARTKQQSVATFFKTLATPPSVSMVEIPHRHY